MKQRKISTYFNTGITCILATIFILVIVIGVWLARDSTISSVVARLDVCLQTAYDRLDLEDAIGRARLLEVIEYEGVASLIENSDVSQLSRVLERCKFDMGESYAVAVDSNGTVIASNVHVAGSSWPLAYLLDSAKQEGETITTTEVIAADRLKDSRQSLRDGARVIIDRTTARSLNDAYVHITVCPIYSGETFVGAVVEGYLLNNNHEFPTDYTNAVPGTYLSVGTTDGVRICSNISSNGFSYPAGTTQRRDFVDVINKGGIWRGQVSMVDGGEGVVVAGPITDYSGRVIGNIGVGSPIFMISGLSASHYVLFVLVAAAFFICAALLGRKLTAMITRPISDLQDISRTITKGELPSSDMLRSRSSVPSEIVSLADDMYVMARKLTDKNQRLEEKVSARTAQLANTVDELRAANRHKSQFLANISHELRTPLNSIIGFASLLQENVAGDLNATQTRYAEIIIESGGHLLDLINDILQLVKLDTSVDKLKLSRVSVIEAIRNPVDLIRPLADERGQGLEVIVADELDGYTAYWDEQKVHQILLNLLSNAVKFSPDGGRIRVKASLVEENFVFIHVIDNGIGISNDMKERVFLAFEQADNSYTRIYKGAGLGLAITKDLVEMHSGRIWLEDAPGGGLDACVVLPLCSNRKPDKKDGQEAD
ncbi:cache domain-containing protein [Olsenella uli]|uniref:cache domain-containing protein n=1 Tax=Olsenella uli TaxID=133926 RepID=UPI0024A92D1C|nr:cache domain-containing protein [Olsenella uli]